VGKPLINLNTTIATLNATVRAVKERLDKQEESNTEEHKEIKAHFEEVDLELANHDLRLKYLEGNK
jgi:hypothetical protein